MPKKAAPMPMKKTPPKDMPMKKTPMHPMGDGKMMPGKKHPMPMHEEMMDDKKKGKR